LDEILTRIPDYTIPAVEDLVYDNVSVRMATSLPIKFTPS